jgi:hypothetical protein
LLQQAAGTHHEGEGPPNGEGGYGGDPYGGAGGFDPYGGAATGSDGGYGGYSAGGSDEVVDAEFHASEE